MSRLDITTSDAIYTVSPDDPVPPDACLRIFVLGQALDDVMQLPLAVPVKVETETPGFVVQVKDRNWFVIAGVLRWQLPMLSSQSFALKFTLSAEGYVSKVITVTIPQTPAGSVPAPVELASANTQLHLQP